VAPPARARIEHLADEATSLVAAGEPEGVALRAVGGIGIWHRLDEPLRKAYADLRPVPGDLDLLAAPGTSRPLQELFGARGYIADERLMLWHGERRHRYFREEGGIEVDVFLGSPPACHDLALDFAAVAPPAPAAAMGVTELLLQKLQIVEVNHKDLLDSAFLLAAEEPVDTPRIAGLLAQDWGFWHTATQHLDLLDSALAGDLPAPLVPARAQAVELRAAFEAAPKTRKWRMRARVGTRVPWYTEVEEVDR
jgi:hypothetical protein